MTLALGLKYLHCHHEGLWTFVGWQACCVTNMTKESSYRDTSKMDHRLLNLQNSIQILFFLLVKFDSNLRIRQLTLGIK